MHELGIVFHVIRVVEDIGRQQQLTDVASVTLELARCPAWCPGSWRAAGNGRRPDGADAPGGAAH